MAGSSPPVAGGPHCPQTCRQPLPTSITTTAPHLSTQAILILSAVAGISRVKVEEAPASSLLLRTAPWTPRLCPDYCWSLP